MKITGGRKNYNEEGDIDSKVQDIISLLIMKTHNKELLWEKSIIENTYYVEYNSGTILIYKSGRIEGEDLIKYIGFRFVSDTDAIYFEKELPESSIEYKTLDKLYQKIKYVALNEFLYLMKKDINNNNFTDPLTECDDYTEFESTDSTDLSDVPITEL